MPGTNLRVLAPMILLLGLLAETSSLAAGDKLSKKDKRWLEQEVGALITAEEVAIFEELDSKDRKLFKEIFWARRDPNTMTPDNEFEKGFKRRVKVADDRFQSQGRSGSATDMGRVYLLLGPPQDSGENWQGQTMAEWTLTDTTLEQTWMYPPNPELGIPDGLTLKFRRQSAFRWRLIATDEINEALDRVKERYANPSIHYELSADGRLMKPLAEVAPNSPAKKLLEDLLANKSESQAIGVEAETYFFRATAKEVYTAVLLDIDGEKLTWDGDTAKATVFAIAEAADGRQTRPVESSVELERDENGKVVYDFPFQLRPGNHSLYVGVLDDESKTVGTRILPFEVPDFDKVGLVSSSVVVFTDTTQVKDPAGRPGHSFQFGNTKFTLKPGDKPTYKNTDTLNVWFFVYGFGLDESGQANLNEQWVFLNDGFRHSRTKAKPLRTEKDMGFMDTGIPLASFPPGNYKAEITITDNVTEETLTKELEFIVVE